MTSETVFRNIERQGLLDAAHNVRAEGYRLVQISATATAAGVYEVNYSFARRYEFVNYRLIVKPGESVPSVSGIFSSAFLYENEMHDLFGILVEDMSVNYKGMFYKLAKRVPYGFPSGPGKAGG
jgi:ech hydrogenase subunit D